MLASTIARRLPGAVAAAASRAAAPAATSASSVRLYGGDNGMKEREPDFRNEPFPPNYDIDSVPPPPYYEEPPAIPQDKNYYNRSAVTSAHAVDATSDPPRLSARDSAALSPGGAVVHGRYGELDSDAVAGVPLEYLALLRHAAEGAAALRQVSGGRTTGTVLIYGASQPAGLAATQLASSSGLAAVAVVGGEHSGESKLVQAVKGLASEPGCAVPEEYALVKKSFRDLVDTVSSDSGPSSWSGHDPDAFLADFKENFLAYVEAYPDTLPAAVSAEHLDFQGKDKDRKTFRDNMETYLSQLPPGEAPLDPARLDAYFPKEQYAAWKAKFQVQAAAVITGEGDDNWHASSLLRDMLEKNEVVDEQILRPTKVSDGSGDYVPYEFSVLDQRAGEGEAVTLPSGGPVLGAVVVVTPDLAAAAEAVAKGKTLRDKAEALQFLTDAQRRAYAGASAVVKEAERAGAPVRVVGGSLPGLETAEPEDADVKAALDAMGMDEYGESKLNFFMQAYRAGDWPVYADYAVHRATQELPGPRAIVVTK